jgi:hypothetical protein
MAHGPCDVTPQPNPLKATVHVSIPGAAEGEVRSDNYLCRRGRPKVAVAFNRNRPGSLASPPASTRSYRLCHPPVSRSRYHSGCAYIVSAFLRSEPAAACPNCIFDRKTHGGLQAQDRPIPGQPGRR